MRNQFGDEVGVIFDLEVEAPASVDAGLPPVVGLIIRNEGCRRFCSSILLCLKKAFFTAIGTFPKASATASLYLILIRRA
jgi:hypothetical protein